MQGFGMVGNLVDTPTVNTTAKGKKVARFTLAVDDGYRDADGAWQTRATVFQRVECWTDAPSAATWSKGSLVAVVGQMRADTYEQDGEPRRQQWFAADVAALVPRERRTNGVKTAAGAAEDGESDDDPYAAAR